MSKISIYQVLPRLFGNVNKSTKPFGSLAENGSGKMNDFTLEVLHEIKSLGITHVWYTGIIEHARCEGNPEFGIADGNPQIIKGRAGSPYAITDYYDIDPDLAVDIPNRINEFKALVERTHKAGLKLIIDFVPNHVARQYYSDVHPETNFGITDDKTLPFSPLNDFYYLPNQALVLSQGMGTVLPTDNFKPYTEHPAKATGNDCFSPTPGLNDWYETIKLNYGIDYLNGHTEHFKPVPPLWDKMVSILLYWSAMGVDAFRCDMAEMVPVAFWDYAIGKIKARFPAMLFIAEVYNPNLYYNYLFYGKFDFLYDKVGLYDTLRNIVSHGSSATAITQCWQSLGDNNPSMLRFLENHDEQRIASKEFAGNAEKAIPAFLATALMHGGPVMLYSGQEFGEPATGTTGYSGDDGRTTIFDYSHLPMLQKWYNNGQPKLDALPENIIVLRKNYTDILNVAISDSVFSDGKFYDLMWDNSTGTGPNPMYVFAFARYNHSKLALGVVNFNYQNSEAFLLRIPENLINSVFDNEVQMLDFKGLYGNINGFKAHKSTIIQKGVWLNIPAGSGVVVKIS